jgi:hypothetical protein
MWDRIHENYEQKICKHFPLICLGRKEKTCIAQEDLIRDYNSNMNEEGEIRPCVACPVLTVVLLSAAP